MTGQFDIKADIEIEKQDSFFCRACLTGKPASEQSQDSRYCQGCHDMLEANKKETTLPKDYWTPDGMFFVTGNYKWG